jgi:S-sulfosulfanyl-L-cysteine sulfohydrolase
VNISRREFVRILGLASTAGMALAKYAEADAAQAQGGLYDLPKFGQVSLLHMTDCHAQLMPIHFREPSVNLGVAEMRGRTPHLVGENLLKHAGIQAGTAQAHALTSLNFETAARQYGKIGGFAHLATLVKQLKASRPGAVLLDGGDTWQGSATALWTQGQDMVEACKLLGVEIMTGHWEFTLGQDRVKEIVDKDFKGKVEFLAQNIRTQDFEDPVFKSNVMRDINGVKVAFLGQAFPYTPIANPRYMVADWTFGIQDQSMQKAVNEVRAQGAQLVILLSHNGMDVDLKMASRISGIDAILGGHTHDGVPLPIAVKNLDVKGGKLVDWRYKLLPIFSTMIKADPEMQSLIQKVRAPYEAKLAEKLAVTEGMLYRRGNFNGSWDQLLLDGLMEVQGAEIAFSPGFRWGTSLLPGQAITRELLMDQVATTYSYATVTEMSGETIKTVLEDVCDNLFNPDPYYQQGGDMVRVGGLSYACAPNEKMGSRIQDMRLKGEPIEANKKYKVAGWAPVAEEARNAGNKMIWDVMESWLQSKKSIPARKINQPRLIGVEGNPGLID